MLMFSILKLSVGINTKTPGAGCTKSRKRYPPDSDIFQRL